MTQDKLLAELQRMITRLGGSGNAKTRSEWEEVWGVSSHSAMRYIHAGVKSGLMRHAKVSRVQVNGTARMTDAYEIVDDKPKGRRRSTPSR